MHTLHDALRQDDLALALARAWWLLSRDHTGFRRLELRARTREVEHAQFCARIRLAIERGPDAFLDTSLLDAEYLLAWLEELDTAAFDWAPRDVLQERRELDGHVVQLSRRRRRLSGSPPAHDASQSGHLYTWHPHHRFVVLTGAPVRDVRIRAVSHATSKRILGWGLEIPVFVSGFADRVLIEWREGIAMGLTDREARWSSLVRSLESGREQEARVVLLPELTIDGELVERASDWLYREDHPFDLVVPGSWHVEDGGLHRNRTYLFDHTGSPILTQDKLWPFAAGDMREAVGPGEVLELVETPAGLLAIPICLDFCQADRMPDFWRSVAPDWLLVPSMSPSLSAHRNAAATFHRAHRTVSVVANQHPTEERNHGGFVFDSGRSNTDRREVPPPGGCLSVSIE